MSDPTMREEPVALITGAARRLGAAIATALHDAGYAVLIHYNHSEPQARALAAKLNALRPASAETLPADLGNDSDIEQLVAGTLKWRSRLDLLVNNASSFFPTPIASATLGDWDDLMATNLKAPFFLIQAARESLAEQRGAVVNLVDINADRPAAEHPIYCAAKAGLVMLTKALARDLAPAIRVNAVAPGAILWPEAMTASESAERSAALARIPMGALGDPNDIAKAVLFLGSSESYVTGQVLAVDGGRSQT